MRKPLLRKTRTVDDTSRGSANGHPSRALAAAAVVFFIVLSVLGQTGPKPLTQAKKEPSKMYHAKGTFEINVHQQKTDNPEAEKAGFGRISSDKQFSGELEGTSLGEMLFTGTAVEGSRGYVALEYVSGKLNGKTGTFVLQHLGWMNQKDMHMSVAVLPDSGTGQLLGITGTMTITIVEGKHHFDLEYSLS